MKKEYIIPTSEYIALLTSDILTGSNDDVEDDVFNGEGEENLDDTYGDDFIDDGYVPKA